MFPSGKMVSNESELVGYKSYYSLSQGGECSGDMFLVLACWCGTVIDMQVHQVFNLDHAPTHTHLATCQKQELWHCGGPRVLLAQWPHKGKWLQGADSGLNHIHHKHQFLIVLIRHVSLLAWEWMIRIRWQVLLSNPQTSLNIWVKFIFQPKHCSHFSLENNPKTYLF